MNLFDLFTYFYYITLLLALASGLYRYKRLDKAARILCLLLGASAITEIIAAYAAYRYHNNIPVYSLYDLVEFLLTALYFNYTISAFRKYNTGIYVGIAGVVCGILNLVFLQPISRFNSNFLFLESTGIIVMSLTLLSELMLNRDQQELKRNPHAWFALIFALFWSVTFLNWPLYDYFALHIKNGSFIIGYSMLAENIAMYGGITAVFLFYPRIQT